MTAFKGSFPWERKNGIANKLDWRVALDNLKFRLGENDLAPTILLYEVGRR